MAPAAGSSGRMAASWLALAGLAGLVALRPVACTDGQDDVGAITSAEVADLLADVGPEVVEPALADFLVQAGALETALSTWDGADGGRAEAQAAWTAAMSSWQRLEVMQIGPAASSLTAVGGADLRDEIYSWPTVNACRVDQETAEGNWDQADFFTGNLVNSYGLDAIEHLLWADAGNACPSQSTPNSDGAWDALGEEGVAANRAAFSRVLAAEITRQGGVLLAHWQGDFGQALANASDPFEDEQQALNAVYDALFYLETMTKDRKLAWPLGSEDCGAESCPDDVEGLESGTGAASVAANLEGFRALFTGGEGTGWDDLLIDLGHQDLSDQVLADTDAALLLAQGISEPLDQLVAEEPAQVQALHDAVKAVTDALKGDLATILNLQIPDEASGDND